MVSQKTMMATSEPFCVTEREQKMMLLKYISKVLNLMLNTSAKRFKMTFSTSLGISLKTTCKKYQDTKFWAVLADETQDREKREQLF